MSEAREGRSLNHALTLTRIALALLRAIHPFPQKEREESSQHR
jgi:hypothetical protein